MNDHTKEVGKAKKLSPEAVQRLAQAEVVKERVAAIRDDFARRVAEQLAPMVNKPPARYVYLAGPILGCTFGEAMNWRTGVAALLAPHNIIGISPLRCEPIHGEVYSAEYPDPRFGTPRAIAAKNRFDVENCDMTLALFPKPTTKPQSVGTILEVGWADSKGKQVIVCSDDPFLAAHPVFDSCVDWKFTTRDADPKAPEHFLKLEDCVQAAVETIIGVLGGYAGGKNV